MHSFTAAAALGLAATSLVSAAPSRAPKNNQFPLNENFPFSNAGQIAKIEEEAFGLLPNVAPPPTLNDDTFTSVRFINFAEQLEAKFFDEFLFNITHNPHNFNRDFPPNLDKKFVIATIKSMRATEELHTQNAINALKNFKKDVIQPCEYKFPVDSFLESLGFIQKVTSFVEGVLGNIVKRAAKNGDAGFTQGVVAAAENEAEQEGWFRFVQNERPNEKPFHTVGDRNMAFSLQQDLIVPGSCPNAFEIFDDIKKILQPLTVVKGDPDAKDQDIEFSVDFVPTRVAPLPDFKIQSFAKAQPQELSRKYGKDNGAGLWITYLNGVQKPISFPIKNRKLDGTKLTFKAEFPFSKFDMFGLTVATLTTKDLTNVAGADEDTVFDNAINGPALIEPKENFPGDEISNDNGRSA